MSLTRLLRCATRDEIKSTLLHGVKGHPFVPEFDDQVRCGVAPFGTSISSRLMFQYSCTRWLRSNANAFDVVLVLSSMISSLLLGEVARKRGCRVVGRIENSTQGLAPRPWYGRLRDIDANRYKILSRMNAVIAMSSLVEAELTIGGVDKRRIARIPQHCDTERFSIMSVDERQEWKKRLGWPRRFTFLFVGEIVHRKRPLLLIECLSDMVKRGLDVQLALVGPMSDVEYGRAIQREVQKHRLEERVLWNGFNRLVQVFYHAADAFVLPSTNECMPSSLIEAMASGLPSIVSDFSGSTDVVEHGKCGWIVPMGDGERDVWVDHMQSAVRRVGDPSFGERAREIVVERMDSRAVWPQYLEVLRGAAHEGGWKASA